MDFTGRPCQSSHTFNPTHITIYSIPHLIFIIKLSYNNNNNPFYAFARHSVIYKYAIDEAAYKHAKILCETARCSSYTILHATNSYA